jgi:hypothetical protein
MIVILHRRATTKFNGSLIVPSPMPKDKPFLRIKNTLVNGVANFQRQPQLKSIYRALPAHATCFD